MPMLNLAIYDRRKLPPGGSEAQFLGIGISSRGVYSVYCNESARSVPSTALSPLTSREHDLTTRRADSAAIEKCLEAAGNIAEYSNTFDGNQEQREGEDPDTYLFEMDEDIKSVLRNMEHLEEKMLENSGNLETKMLENSSNLEGRVIEKNVGKYRNLEAKMLENCVNLEERLENKLSETKQQLDHKIREIESQFALLSSKTDLSPPGAADENVGEVNSSPNKDVKIKEGKESPACSVAGDKEQHSIRHTTCETKMRMKPPQFDGKTPAELFASATALTLALRGDATDILQTLSSTEQADYEQLIKHLEMRYGQTNLEHVYHSQLLKNRYQKPSETLKEFQVDISRLVRLAYPATPEAVMERLARQSSVLKDKLDKRIRQVVEDSNGDTMEATIRKFVKEALSEAKKVQCWKCGKVGHIRRRCPENQAGRGYSNSAGKTKSVASLEHQSNSIFIDAVVDGKPRELLLDTGATRTIIRPDIVGTSTKVKPTPWRLRTATGQPATIYGEVGVIFNIGNTCFNGQVLVADIEDELILGMDIMNTKGFKLDFKRGVLQINEEEVVLHGRTEERVRVVLAEDSSLSERCEAILYACPDGQYGEGSIMMVEPGTHDSEGGHGVVIGKSLSHVRKIVPVRVMNANYHPVTLKKRTVLGYCCPVASIVRSLGKTGENSAEISAELEALIKTSSRHLKMDQRKMLRSLIEEFRNIFDDGSGSRGRTNLVQHTINTGDARPIRQVARRGIAAAFKEKFGNVDELRRQRPEVGDVLQLGGDETSRRVFYLVTKHLSRDKPTYENVWESLISLRGALLSQEVTHLAIPKLSCGLDGLNWRVVRNMLEVLFQFTGIEVLVCSYHPGVPIAERTVDCYFYQQSRCKKGSLCRYRHHPTLRTLSGTERCLRRGQCNESASSVPSTALSPLTSREHDLTTSRADSAAIEKCLEAAGNIADYSNTFDGNQEQRVGSRS
ncbi:hypothetical protein NQ317_009071 [Molorchus minor]|uniref:Cleavage and polyadenylation specificity factor subunit 4 n=1 Tax=Molorchus minor TaxID=1323400 RepID=A0ABQ9ISC6_9CUCU|nr:hypothetical protein NQ317_009071 [Molorchus minor]